MEEWKNLEDLGFSNYAISSWGRFRNDRTGRQIIGSKNNQGFVKVGATSDYGWRATLSTTPLVAHAFVEGQTEIFNTPIHLDGNKEHNFADNLAWRPRWFAIKYHRQFKDRKNWLQVPLIEIKTEEVFQDAREAIVKYGLLGVDITLSVMNHRPVFPTGQEFRTLE